MQIAELNKCAKQTQIDLLSDLGYCQIDHSSIVATDKNGDIRVTPFTELSGIEDKRLLPQFSKILPQTHFIPYQYLANFDFACQETINAIYFFDLAFRDSITRFSQVQKITYIRANIIADQNNCKFTSWGNFLKNYKQVIFKG